jgi:hypothetical protein
MEFAAPAALALGLFALPLTALFLMKQKPRALRTATLLFWDEALPLSRRRTAVGKLRDPLLLTVSLILLALLVTAAGMPQLASPQGGVERTVVVIDDSVGMNATDVAPSRFESARERLHRTIGSLRNGQTLALVSAGSEPRILCGFESDPGALRKLADSLTPGNSPRRLDEALELARRLLAGHPGRIVLFSGAARKPKGDDFLWSPVGESVPNLGISHLSVRRCIVTNEFETQIEVKNASEHSCRAQMEIRLGGNPIHAVSLHLGPEEVWSDIIRSKSSSGGRVHARLIEVEPRDSLPIDDEAWAVLSAFESVSVTLLTPSGAPSHESIVNALESLNLVKRPVRLITDANPTVDEQSINIFYRHVPKVLPNGPIIVVDPQDSCDHWTIAGPVAETEVRVHSSQSPLIAGLNLGPGLLGKPLAVRPKGDVDVAVETLSGEAVVFEVLRRGDRPVIVLATDLVDGGLKFHPSMVGLFGNAIHHLIAQKPDDLRQARCGDLVRIPRLTTPGNELRSPSGRVSILPLSMPEHLGPLNEPGVWSIGQIGEPDATWQVAVQSSLAEDIDLRPAASGADQVDLPPSLPLWAWLVVVSGMFLVLEWLAYHRRWIG